MTKKNETDMGGPLGLGDPDDRTLNNVERQYHLPRLCLEEASKRCKEISDSRDDCMVKYGISGLILCRELRRNLDNCLARWIHDPDLVQERTNFYLKMRREYRLKGEVEKPQDNENEAEKGQRVKRKT